MDEIRKRIKAAMDARSMTASDLAEKSGIDKGAISRYLAGKVIPKQSKIDLMAKSLDVSPSWLLGYDVDEHGKLTADLDLNALTDENRARVLAYYQALLDSQEGPK